MNEPEIRELPELQDPEAYIALLGCFASNVDLEQDRRIDKSEGIGNVSSLTFMDDSNARQKSAEQAIPLLDALAAICVSQSRQNFAVTMSLSPQEVKLYVAENNTVPEDVVTHLHSIWKLVRKISARLHPPPPKQGSPALTSDPSIASLVRQLEYRIYAFSFGRLKKRFKKRWAPLKEFLLFLVSAGHIPKHLALPGMFMRLARELSYSECPDSLPVTHRHIHMGLESIQFFTEEKEDWWNSQEQVYLRKKNRVKETERVAQPSDTTESNGDIRLDAHRHISKLLSLRGHIEAITQVALSHRFSEYIHSSAFDVKVVPPYTRTGVDINPPPDFVENLARAIFLDFDPERDEKIQDVVKEARGRYCYREHKTYNAHCECTLLLYHMRHPEGRPLRYIGTSKFLCLACNLFFEAYSHYAVVFGHEPFYFRGTHWKLCAGGWISLVPQAAASERDRDFLTAVIGKMAREAEDWLKKRMKTKAESGRGSHFWPTEIYDTHLEDKIEEEKEYEREMNRHTPVFMRLKHTSTSLSKRVRRFLGGR
ncbi:hypothetical protein BOTBODRAFT_170961 [Botryobasidium botryosum FD-172 SS1]|uniref:Uncharacterized protein n=1 Tax=Botryobasidium botryosum (strain FD-172 SS1) TaxID=930990 RepID=A0A067N5E1_BOTB1|nr:hypothetical protein BOTBODRAFT_170961 [Botryobasidium botryosum FD-172 SS1]